MPPEGALFKHRLIFQGQEQVGARASSRPVDGDTAIQHADGSSQVPSKSLKVSKM
jgi:hypothetical protein